MKVRWILRNGEKILQYYAWILKKDAGGKLVETYEWQDVPYIEG